MAKRSTQMVLVGEAWTSKVKDKRAERWKKKKDKTQAAAATRSALVALVGMRKGKRKVVQQLASKDKRYLHKLSGNGPLEEGVHQAPLQ
ncbi:UNVERIFIED_CONTAM: hypothetical protein Sradi_1579800 [Sesamum radiatum]|uniref:Uncharacterized protein n=1 Tax=Sesamum radiatum TaxID=300843 RepID=A0AAW2U8U0_SESRA